MYLLLEDLWQALEELPSYDIYERKLSEIDLSMNLRKALPMNRPLLQWKDLSACKWNQDMPQGYACYGECVDRLIWEGSFAGSSQVNRITARYKQVRFY